MQVSVEAGEGLERRMKVDLPPEQINDEVEKRLRDFARSARLPGFRPGKVPMKLLRQRYGNHLLQEVLGDLVQSSFADAVRRESLHPAGMPGIEPVLDAESRPCGYIATFDVLPEIVPVPLTGRTLKRPVCAIAESDIDAMVDQLRTQRQTWQAVDRPCQPGDRVTVAFTGTIDGEPFDGGSSERLVFELGRGRMLPDFENGLIGAAGGERRTLEVAMPETPSLPSAVSGKQASFNVTLNFVEAAVLPEVDADFVANFGIEDGDLVRFRADVRANMERELEGRLESLVKERVMDQLIETHEAPTPAVMLREEARAMNEEMRRTLGTTAGLEIPDNLFAAPARRRVQLRLILGALIRHWDLTADPAAVRARVERAAAAYEDPQSVIRHFYSDPARLASVESLVLEQLIVERVLEEMTVEDEPMSFQELTARASAG